jgi:hypothetical protein
VLLNLGADRCLALRRVELEDCLTVGQRRGVAVHEQRSGARSATPVTMLP